MTKSLHYKDRLSAVGIVSTVRDLGGEAVLVCEHDAGESSKAELHSIKIKLSGYKEVRLQFDEMFIIDGDKYFVAPHGMLYPDLKETFKQLFGSDFFMPNNAYLFKDYLRKDL